MRKKTFVLLLGAASLLFTADIHSLAGSGAWYDDDSGSARSELYRSGQKALDQGDWSEAAVLFEEVVAAEGNDVDAGLYWLAYCRVKQGQYRQAQRSLRELERSYPESPWVDDAKALGAEAKQLAGNGDVSADLEDEELKLYAVNSLMHLESERAVPIVESLLAGDNSDEIKEKALFVLTQTDSKRAREILVEVATHGEPPHLRHTALEYLGLCDNPGAELEQIYSATTDRRTRMQVLESLMIADEEDLILRVARTEADPKLRGTAIELLGVLDAGEELRALYEQEQDLQLRGKILDGLMIAEDVDALVEVATSEGDPELRGRAIQALGIVETRKSREALRELYGNESDPRLRATILEAMFIGEDHESLIEVIRTESDPGLKRKALEYLSHMDSEEAAEYLLELLEN